MSCFSCISLTKNLTLASMNPNTPPPPPETNNKNSKIIIPMKKPRRNQQPKPRRPSLIQIERAIGAGRFRDADPRELEEDRKTVFDQSSFSFTGKYEGSLMKNLRETGEWLTNQTETKFQASGKRFLLFTFQWVLPIWALSFLVASGIIKLPFSSPFTDEFLM